MKWSNTFNSPYLPVPKLDETLIKYLKSVEPFLNEYELANTKEIVNNFGKDEGRILQDYLEKKAENCENWVIEWWNNMMFLDCRTPTTIFSSPGVLFPLQKFRNEDDRSKYAAKLILGALDYKYLIDKDLVPREIIGGQLIDMNQYKKIYGTCRIQRPSRDELEFNPNSKHIIVAKNNNFFKMVVITSEGHISSFSQIFYQLSFIIESSEIVGVPFGLLTSDNRDNWYHDYNLLNRDQTNREVVDAIQKSLFLLCLDNALPTLNDDVLSLATKQCVHGGGHDGNSGNRWFDKTLQFIVSSDGIVGITFEHAPCEGNPIAAITDHIVEYIGGNAWEALPDVKIENPPELMRFNIGDELSERINIAALNLDRYIQNLQFSVLNFTRFGKDFVKSQNLSPDSFIQMAIQYAFYRVHKVPGAHYEAASAKKFIHGRTETIRSCSIESVAFAKKMLNSDSSDAEKIKFLRKAVNTHKAFARDAVNGYGIDRHLLGLKMAAEELGGELPAIYNDVAFSRTSYMRLDTSQIAFKCEGVVAFKPLVPDGYSCCYNPRSKCISFSLSCFLDNSDTDMDKFKSALESCLVEMHDLLSRNK